MKYLNYIFTVFFFLSITLPLFGQGQIADPTTSNPLKTQPRGKNLISSNAYQAIAYNGFTVNQINNVSGSYNQLWGSPRSIENSASWSTSYTYGENRISYNTEFDYTQGITILDDQWLIKVLGKEIRVGDSFSELKQKFGSDLKIIYKPAISSRYVVSFDCSGNDYDGLLIYFNPITHEVVEIKYFVNT